MAQPMTRRGMDIEDGNEIEPALSGKDAGGVSDPSLIGALDGEVWEPVGGDRSAVLAVGCPGSIFGTLPRENPLRAHKPGDAVAPAGAAERLSQARAAIGLAAAGKLSANPGA